MKCIDLEEVEIGKATFKKGCAKIINSFWFNLFLKGWLYIMWNVYWSEYFSKLWSEKCASCGVKKTGKYCGCWDN